MSLSQVCRNPTLVPGPGLDGAILILVRLMRHFSEQQVSCLVIQLSGVSPPRAFNYAGAARRIAWKGEPSLSPYQQHNNRQIQYYLYNVENHAQHHYTSFPILTTSLEKGILWARGFRPSPLLKELLDNFYQGFDEIQDCGKQDDEC